LEVAKLVWDDKKTYREAFRILTLRKNLKSPQTVPDACTRQIGVATKQFEELLKNRDKFVNHLIRRFPMYKELIVKELTPYLSLRSGI